MSANDTVKPCFLLMDGFIKNQLNFLIFETAIDTSFKSYVNASDKKNKSVEPKINSDISKTLSADSKSINSAFVQNDPKAMFQVAEGDIYIETVGYGLIMKNSAGECLRFKPDNNGVLNSSSIVCPN